MSIYHPAVFVSKKVYDSIGGFSLQFKYAMDVEFIHRCLYNKVDFFYVPSTLTNFRLGGTSGVNFRNSYREFYESVKMYNDFPLAKFYYYLGVSKKYLLSTKFGALIMKNRNFFKLFLSGKDK